MTAGLVLAAILAAPAPTPTRTPTPYTGANTRGSYRLTWVVVADPFLGTVRKPDLGTDSRLTSQRCPGFKWKVNEAGSTVMVDAPTALHTALSVDYARVDGWRPFFSGITDWLVTPAMGFGGDHFTTDSSADYTGETDTLQGTWTFGTSSTVTLTGGTGDCRQISTGEDSVNQTIWARGKTSSDTTGPFGTFCNRQGILQFYLSYAVSNEWRIYSKNTTYTQLATAASTIDNDTYYVTKFESLTDGSNKILTLSVNGVTMTGPVTTATLYGSGGYGLDGNASVGSTITWDWLIGDPNLALSLPVRSAVPSGGAVTFPGTDFGIGYLLKSGGKSYTSVTNSGSTTITGNAPLSMVGVYPVTVYFGTAGSEEFTSFRPAAVNIFTGSGVRSRRP